MGINHEVAPARESMICIDCHDNPSFSFREFRSNLVVRWEYKPGSALYAVWSQGRTSDSELSDDSLGNNFDALWRSSARNVFLVKLQHWFSM